MIIKTRILLRGALVIVLLLVGVGIARASGFNAGPLVLLSGPSPFANCTVGGITGSVLYNNAEEEPWVDVNPTNPNNFVAVWQQDRWSDGGAHGLATGVSHDGGATWSETFAHFSLCSGGTSANGGDFERASDPWVTFAPNGDAYQIALAFNATDAQSGVLVSKSSDGGDTWSEPVTLKRDSGLRDSSYAFNDKESITADPTNANYVYAVWDRFVTPSGTSAASIMGYIHSRSFRQPIWFARTTDGGVTWEPARKIYDRSELNGTLGNQIVVLPNGTLLDVFDEFFLAKNSQKMRGASISLIRSTDQGVTWPKRSTVVAKDLAIGAFDPDTGRPIRAEGGIPEVAVDPNSGAIYIVWQDSRFSNGEVDEIAFSMSTDGGFTWSAPVKVNQTPTTVDIKNQQAFVPSVRVAADGTIAVTYYDFRYNALLEPGVQTDYWMAHCHPSAGSCSDAAKWGDEVRLSPSSFDIEQAPAARGPFGFFLGDYEGLSNVGNAFLPVFIQVNNGNAVNRTDVFGTQVGP